MAQLRKELCDHLRPFLKPPGFTQELVDWIDGWADRAGIPRDTAPAPPPPPRPAPPPAPRPAPVPPPVPPAPRPAPVPPPAPAAAAADDRYVPLFATVAGRAADDVIRAMARSFARHAPAFGQDGSKARIAEFVAQISNETGGFTKFHENLNYTAKRIREVWPSRVTTDAQAAGLANNPEALANVVYARPNEGNTQPGDGWKYRGRGALQLTFRNNYRHFGQLTGLPLEAQPDLAADPAASVLIALQFFKVGKVNAAIDRGDFREARRITNGGELGLEEVARLRARALAQLG